MTEEQQPLKISEPELNPEHPFAKKLAAFAQEAREQGIGIFAAIHKGDGSLNAVSLNYETAPLDMLTAALVMSLNDAYKEQLVALFLAGLTNNLQLAIRAKDWHEYGQESISRAELVAGPKDGSTHAEMLATIQDELDRLKTTMVQQDVVQMLDQLEQELAEQARRDGPAGVDPD